MKKLFILFILASLYTSIQASEIIPEIKDTTFTYNGKIISVTGSEDSMNAGVYTVTANGDTVPFKTKDPESNVYYDGASYNFIFSWKKNKHLEPHWDGAGFAFIGLNGLDDASLDMSKSYSITVNLMNYHVSLDRSHWLFFSGLGLDWSRYHFKGDYGLTEINGITQFAPAPEGIHYNSSKLLAYYFTIPLMFEYQSVANKNAFHVSGGLVGYLKCYSKSQVEYYIDSKKIQENKGRDLNILPVNARLMLQLGFRSATIFGYYSPFSLFSNNKGPEVYPYGIGIRFTGN